MQNRDLLYVMMYNTVSVTAMIVAVAVAAIRFDNAGLLWFWLIAPFLTLSYKTEPVRNGKGSDEGYKEVENSDIADN